MLKFRPPEPLLFVKAYLNFNLLSCHFYTNQANKQTPKKSVAACSHGQSHCGALSFRPPTPFHTHTLFPLTLCPLFKVSTHVDVCWLFPHLTDPFWSLWFTNESPYASQSPAPLSHVHSYPRTVYPLIYLHIHVHTYIPLTIKNNNTVKYGDEYIS